MKRVDEMSPETMPLQPQEFYLEEVLETFGGVVTRSNVRVATTQEVERAKDLHANGQCDHSLIVDDKGWLYDFRYCVLCGHGLGTV